MRKKIVLDLDGVISDIAASIDEYLKDNDLGDLDYSKWLITDTKNKQALYVFSDELFWKNMKPIKTSWHQVNDWFNNGIDVNIVTARRTKQSMSSTVPWLEQWNINTVPPYFSGLGKKIDIIKTIDPLFVVEDNPNEIKILKKAGIKCFLMKAWYNRDYWNSMDSIGSLQEIDLENL